jgi:Cof subfamily protein (haloacid dehalogenase superfamily)
MKKPYLIAVDLDGTLLTDQKTISPKTEQTLQKAISAGHHVVISTGRPYRASKPYYDQLGLQSPIINFNGAFIHHPHDKGWGVYHSPLDLQTAKTIIKTCEDFQVKNIMVEVIDDVFLRNHDEVIIDTFVMGQSGLQTGDLHKILLEDPTSILIQPENFHVQELRDHLAKQHAEVIDHRVWAAPWNIIEVVKAGLNKAIGLDRVAKHLNIPRERIIAFGDEDNDLEMIEYAHHGIAMGNAIQELKNIAYYVTKTNEEDGISHYLEDVLSLNKD